MPNNFNDSLNPEDYLLESDKQDDDFLFLAPIREKVFIKPIIDGADTFHEIADSIAKAKYYIYMTYWAFDPTQKVDVSVRGKLQKNTWLALLTEAAKRRVDIRIIISDFDPVLHYRHPKVWDAYRQIQKTVGSLSPLQQLNFQVICSFHEKTLKPGFVEWKAVFSKKWDKKVEVINAKPEDMKSYPGLWPFISMKKGQVKDKEHLIYESPSWGKVRDEDWRVFPACHHQKTCVVDDEVALFGGIDIDKGRDDTRLHKGLWHDIHCRVEGAIVSDIKRNFVGRWNKEIEAFHSFVGRANEHAPIVSWKLQKSAVTSIPSQVIREVKTTPGTAYAQVHRTISTQQTCERADIMKVYEKAIKQASKFIYIETQYLREEKVAEWILKRRKECPELQVIVVAQVKPEEKNDAITKHGMHLQFTTIMKLKESFKNDKGVISNLGLYYLRAKTSKSNAIYIHSKILIVDDVFCSIGSANANPRSFHLDTELNVSWIDPDNIKRFREELWRELLGTPSMATNRGIEKGWMPGKSEGLRDWTDSKNFVSNWNFIAAQNRKAPPSKRWGYIMSYPDKIPEGETSFFIKDEWADLYQGLEEERLA